MLATCTACLYGEQYFTDICGIIFVKIQFEVLYIDSTCILSNAIFIVWMLDNLVVFFFLI